jgi:hypothetical protein
MYRECVDLSNWPDRSIQTGTTDIPVKRKLCSTVIVSQGKPNTKMLISSRDGFNAAGVVVTNTRTEFYKVYTRG